MSDIFRIECDSHIDHAAVYARGAVVTRTVHLPASLPDAPVSICVGKITAFCEFQSFSAELVQEAPDAPGQGREIVAVRPKLVLAQAPVPKSELFIKAREALLSRVRLNLERAHIQKRRDLLATLIPDPGLFKKAYRTRHPEAKTLDALSAGSLIAAELDRLDLRLWELAEALDENKLLQESIDAEAAYAAEAETSSMAQVEAVIELGPGGPISGLSLSYAVVQARWAPTYTARFSEGGTRVSLSLSALVAQQSGEDWSQIRLSLSTADRISDATLPKLQALRLGREHPPSERGYRAPPNGLDFMFVGYDRFTAALGAEESGEFGHSAGALGKRTAGAVHHDETTRVGTSMDARSEMLADELHGPKTTPGQPTLHSADRASGEAHTPAPQALARGMALPAEVSATMPRTESLRISAPGGGGAGAGDVPQAEQTLAGAVSMPDMRSTGRLSTPEELTLDADEEGGAGEAVPIAVRWPNEAFLQFDDLIMPDPRSGLSRGKLSREPIDDAREWPLRKAQKEKEKATSALYNQAMPRGTEDPWGHRKTGFFDVRYDAQGRTDVPCNGNFCQVFVQAWETGSAMRFVSAPKEAEEVYREAELQNPARMPLLQGPVELFFDQAYVALSSMSHVDRGGTIVLGLGVEERLKIRRNTRVSESSAGLLGGSTVIDHAISIELSSVLGRDTQITVLDRIPVTDDKDVEVKLLSSVPAAESYSQADRGSPIRKGLRFQIPLQAGGKASIEFRYKVTLPSKSELLGGNRRES